MSGVRGTTLVLEPVACCLCGSTAAEPVAVGEDFEYRTSDDTFLAVRCPRCSLVYLDPRPTEAELGTIYPDDYHAFEFSEERYGLVHTVRSRLEAWRVLRAARGLPAHARVLDVGCGDGFHLSLLEEHGPGTWRLEGIDVDGRAVEAARSRGLEVHHGRIEDAGLPEAAYDLALLIQTVEHVADPPGLLRAVHRVLRPGGRLLVVTDNTGSLDFRLFRSRHWGGYHFPRHWNLFDEPSLRKLAEVTGFEVATLSTMVSPVNWTYSVRNALDDLDAPRRLVDGFSLTSAPALAVFTAWDALHRAAGRGALLRAVLRRPA